MKQRAGLSAVILLGTLKKTEQSNTEILSEFFVERLSKRSVACEIVRLVDHKILPGTYSDMGEGDEWPGILEKILASDIVIFATPIWWSGQSSEIQRVIERLDELHDEIMEGRPSRLEGKAGGVIITGDSDGAQHIIANLANFFNAIGLELPPFASLSVLAKEHRKGIRTSRTKLLAKYEKEYGKTADQMADQLIKASSKD